MPKGHGNGGGSTTARHNLRSAARPPAAGDPAAPTTSPPAEVPFSVTVPAQARELLDLLGSPELSSEARERALSLMLEVFERAFRGRVASVEVALTVKRDVR